VVWSLAISNKDVLQEGERLLGTTISWSETIIEHAIHHWYTLEKINMMAAIPESWENISRLRKQFTMVRSNIVLQWRVINLVNSGSAWQLVMEYSQSSCSTWCFGARLLLLYLDWFSNYRKLKELHFRCFMKISIIGGIRNIINLCNSKFQGNQIIEGRRATSFQEQNGVHVIGLALLP